MPNNPATEGQVPLERVEIHFDPDFSKVIKVSVMAQGFAEPKIWPPEKKEFDSRIGPTFFAFLLACVKAAKQGMKINEIVLDGSPGKTFHSLNVSSNEATNWARHLLYPTEIRNYATKPAILGSFSIHSQSKPFSSHTTLRQAFVVSIHAGDQNSDFSRAEEVLEHFYNQSSKNSGSSPVATTPKSASLHNFPAARCHKFIKRPEVEKALKDALRSEKSIIWLFGEEGAGKAETLRHVLVDSLAQIPFESVVWIDIRPDNSVAALNLPQILAQLGLHLGLDRLLPKNNPDHDVAATLLSQQAVLIVFQHYEAFVDHNIFNWLTKLNPSKTVVISCQSPQDIQEELSHPVKVQTMNPTERAEFLKLRLGADNSKPLPLSASDEQEIFKITGSNPQRIAKAISLLRRGFSQPSTFAAEARSAGDISTATISPRDNCLPLALAASIASASDGKTCR